MSHDIDGIEAARLAEELGYSSVESIMPNAFIGKVRPTTNNGFTHVAALVDYFNLVTEVLQYSRNASPSLEVLCQTYLQRLLVDGDIQIEADLEPDGRLFSPVGSNPPIREHAQNCFFRLWSIPLPQLPVEKFSGDTATVMDLQIHLHSVGLNKKLASIT